MLMLLRIRNFSILFILLFHFPDIDGVRSKCKDVSSTPPANCPPVIELIVLILTKEHPKGFQGMPGIIEMIGQIVGPCNHNGAGKEQSRITFITDIRPNSYNWTVHSFSQFPLYAPQILEEQLFVTYSDNNESQYDIIGAISTIFTNRSTHSAAYANFTTAVYIFSEITCTYAYDNDHGLMDLLGSNKTADLIGNLTSPVRLFIMEQEDVFQCSIGYLAKASHGYFDYQVNVTKADPNLSRKYGFCRVDPDPTAATGTEDASNTFTTTLKPKRKSHTPLFWALGTLAGIFSTTLKPKRKSHTPLFWALGTLAGIFSTIFLIFTLRRCCCPSCPLWFDSENHRRMSEKIREMEKSGMDMRVRNSYKGDSNHNASTHSLPPKTYDQWEVDPDQLLITEQKLGSGAYAVVHKAMLSGKPPVFRIFPALQLANILSDTENVVAAKTPRKMATLEDRIDFLREIDFMKKLDYYPHLLSLIGCSTSVQYPVILTEFCALGDLLQLVRTLDETSETPQLTFDDLVPICWQMSDALAYLETRKVIHRDVAARNVLVTNEKMAKLSDFGLCRTNEEMLYTTRGGKLPLRWMAPESIDFAIFTAKTDVWSYGILLYEVFSFGKTPFMSVDADNLSQYLNEGNRLSAPEKTPMRLSTIMTDCWRQNPDDRPEITVIRDAIYSMMEAESVGYGYLTFSKNYYDVFRELKTHDVDFTV